MAEQLALTGTEPKGAELHLKPPSLRQQQALDYISAHQGVTAEEVGAHLHSLKDRRAHPAHERCDWCARDGNSVLRSKAVAPLVTYRLHARGRVYTARTPGDAVRAPGGVLATSDPNPATNPFADL